MKPPNAISTNTAAIPQVKARAAVRIAASWNPSDAIPARMDGGWPCRYSATPLPGTRMRGPRSPDSVHVAGHGADAGVLGPGRALRDRGRAVGLSPAGRGAPGRKRLLRSSAADTSDTSSPTGKISAKVIGRR